MRAHPLIPAITVAAALALGHGCTLPLDGLPPDGAGGAVSTASATTTAGAGTGPTECTSDVACGKGGPCFTFTCVMGGCTKVVAPDETPIDDAKGNCTRTVCMGGVPVNAPDPLDFVDDANPCTIAGCGDSGPTQSPGNDGAPCGTGQFCLAGVCRECAIDANCPADMDPCTTAVCANGTCASKNNNDPCDNNGAGFCVAGKCCSAASACLTALSCCAANQKCTILGCK